MHFYKWKCILNVEKSFILMQLEFLVWIVKQSILLIQPRLSFELHDLPRVCLVISSPHFAAGSLKLQWIMCMNRRMKNWYCFKRFYLENIEDLDGMRIKALKLNWNGMEWVCRPWTASASPFPYAAVLCFSALSPFPVLFPSFPYRHSTSLFSAYAKAAKNAIFL